MHPLLASSSLTLVSVAASLRCGQTSFAVAQAAVFASSVNYWRRPIRGVRRNLDVITVLVSGAYHVWRSSESRWQRAYLSAASVAVCCYARARRGGLRSTAWHAALHVVAYAANLVLLAGL
jgi:hypothetical protein